MGPLEYLSKRSRGSPRRQRQRPEPLRGGSELADTNGRNRRRVPPTPQSPGWTDPRHPHRALVRHGSRPVHWPPGSGPPLPGSAPRPRCRSPGNREPAVSFSPLWMWELRLRDADRLAGSIDRPHSPAGLHPSPTGPPRAGTDAGSPLFTRTRRLGTPKVLERLGQHAPRRCVCPA